MRDFDNFYVQFLFVNPKESRICLPTGPWTNKHHYQLGPTGAHMERCLGMTYSIIGPVFKINCVHLPGANTPKMVHVLLNI